MIAAIFLLATLSPLSAHPEPQSLGILASSIGRPYRAPEAQHARPPRSRYSITIPLDPPLPGLPKPKIYGPAGRPLVVIDAGHGGHDPGAVSPENNAREKDVTLSVARAIRDELIRSGRVRVALTREDDRFLVLGERSAIDSNIKADLFISIHADSASQDTATGATVYTLSEVASDREAQILAQRENRADIINGVNLGGSNAPVASILVDLAQRETMDVSATFANLLKRESAGLVPFRGDFHRMAGFVVLKAPDTASILFEVGYVTNKEDLERLRSKAGLQNLAIAVRKAVNIHFARRLGTQ